MPESKLIKGLARVGYAMITSRAPYSYENVKMLAGTRNVSLEASGDKFDVYATGETGACLYYSEYANNGYTGTIEAVNLPDEVRRDWFGEESNSNSHMQMEYANQAVKRFALVVQFEDDQNGTVHVFYDCVPSRSPISAQVKETAYAPQYPSINITATPRITDLLVRTKSTADATTAEKQQWFNEIPEPASKVATPAATPAQGAVTSGATVALSCATDGATIYYTTNGLTPTSESTAYTTPIEITADTMIKAIAVKTDMADSNVFTGIYTVE